MSEKVSHLENPLLEEDTYNGRMFHLSLPKTGELNWAWLKEELKDSSVTLDEQDNVDFAERDDLYVPDIFQSGVSEDAEIASVQSIQEFHREGIDGVLGILNHNESNTVKYDGEEVLTLDQNHRKFLIFEYNGQAFLLIMASRDSIKMLYNLISNVLENLGFIVEEIFITHDEFEEIADRLIDTHMMTSIEDYEEASIHKKNIIGRGYGEAQEYKREKQQGSVRGQRFGTSQLDANSKTIQISGDCLIRGYHKLTFSMYLSMITSYIIPSLSLTIQTSATAYGSETSRVKMDQVSED